MNYLEAVWKLNGRCRNMLDAQAVTATLSSPLPRGSEFYLGLGHVDMVLFCT